MASFAPEIITQVGAIPITNTLINTFFVDTFIIGGVVALNKKLSKIPGMLQVIAEYIIETFYSFIETIAGENTKKIFPFVVSFFLVILVTNWSGLIPGISTIGFFRKEAGTTHFVPFMKNATSDLNATFAMAIISLVATHILSIKAVGIKEYISRYVSLNPINLFVGILEIISEFTKIISLSFRLFGNIFAGEVVLLTISTLFAFVFPIPFIFLEIIVGFVQALVFSLLTMVFMSILMTPHHQESGNTKEVIVHDI